jgi:hypothetical protein
MKGFLQRHAFLRRLLLLLIVFFCFRAAVKEVKAHRQFSETKRWPSAEATVESATVRCIPESWTTHCNRYCPQLQYQYSIRNEVFDATNRVFDFSCATEPYEFVIRHQPGKQVRIAYDPSNPTISIIPEVIVDPGPPYGDVVGGLFFVFLLVLDLMKSWHGEEDAIKADAPGGA